MMVVFFLRQQILTSVRALMSVQVILVSIYWALSGVSVKLDTSLTASLGFVKVSW